MILAILLILYIFVDCNSIDHMVITTDKNDTKYNE
jgi:hypothetical protein